MALRLLRYEGDPILKKHSREIPEITDRIKELAVDMIETLATQEGVGLSGPQVGVLKRIIVVNFDKDSVDEEQENLEEYQVFDEGPIVAINPEIVESNGEICAYEGCLSFPDLSGKVTRPETVTVRYTDLDGNEVEATYSGMIARCFCHEIDHLDGIVFVDRVEADSLIKLDELSDE